jgi:hypothetical protein
MTLLQTLTEKLDDLNLREIDRFLTHTVIAYLASNYHVLWKDKFSVCFYLGDIETSVDAEPYYNGPFIVEEANLRVINLNLNVFHV